MPLMNASMDLRTGRTVWFLSLHHWLQALDAQQKFLKILNVIFKIFIEKKSQ